MDADPSTKERIVVIGAGMGGLAAAIRLAAQGQSVTLVEALATPGGKMRAIPSPAGPIDAGPTVLTMRGVFDDLFALAGERLEDHLTLLPQTVLARHWWPDGGPLDLTGNTETDALAIEAFAGAREAAGLPPFRPAGRGAAPGLRRPGDAGRDAQTGRDPCGNPCRSPRFGPRFCRAGRCPRCLRGSSATRAWSSFSRAMPPMSAAGPPIRPACSR